MKDGSDLQAGSASILMIFGSWVSIGGEEGNIGKARDGRDDSGSSSEVLVIDDAFGGGQCCG